MVVTYRPHRFPLPVEGRAQTPREAAGLVAAMLANETVEQVLVLHLDTKRNLIGVHTASRGTLDGALVHPREIFKVALLANAASVILAHNHPSGDATPSAEDIVMVRRLREAGELLHVPLDDALIVTDPAQGSRYWSFREQGLLA
jgi:DNA repair protein RadC